MLEIIGMLFAGGTAAVALHVLVIGGVAGGLAVGLARHNTAGHRGLRHPGSTTCCCGY